VAVHVSDRDALLGARRKRHRRNAGERRLKYAPAAYAWIGSLHFSFFLPPES
jgi:hypothetical protein